MTRARNWFDVGHYRRKFTAFVFYRSLSPSLPPPPPPPPPRPSVYHLLGSTQPVAPVKVLLFPGRRPFPRPFEFRFSREWPFFHSKSPDHSSILRLCLPVYGVVANLGRRHDSANGIINSIRACRLRDVTDIFRSLNHWLKYYRPTMETFVLDSWNGLERVVRTNLKLFEI